MKTDAEHIPFEKLADMAEGRLATDARADVERHVSLCGKCGSQLSELARLMTLMRSDDSRDAPRDVLFATIDMFTNRAAATKSSVFRRLVATLSFDSSTLRPAYGVRSGQAAAARQMLFSAGGFDVDLRVSNGAEGWTISGQILGPCEGGGTVEILDPATSDSITEASRLNSLCEFALPPVPSGTYAIRLRLNDLEVEIPISC